MPFTTKSRLWRVLTALLIAVAVTLFTAGAYAQKMGGKGGQAAKPDDAATIEKKKKAREIDDAYHATLKGIPDKPKTDPWGGMR